MTAILAIFISVVAYILCVHVSVLTTFQCLYNYFNKIEELDNLSESIVHLNREDFKEKKQRVRKDEISSF